MNKQSSESQSISDWWNVTSNLSISEWLDGSVPRSYGEVPEPKASASGLDTSSKDHRGQASLGRESPLSAANG
jgi:hypothetical protein